MESRWEPAEETNWALEAETTASARKTSCPESGDDSFAQRRVASPRQQEWSWQQVSEARNDVWDELGGAAIAIPWWQWMAG